MGLNHLTKAEQKEVLSDRDFWDQFAKNGWRLHGFSGRHSATFIHPDKPTIGWGGLTITHDHLIALGVLDDG